ncbi:peptidylprolyl isomerase [Paenibacillus sp. LHD-38]|uniref:peptidylprolyl isomerase n=1 Tax=Paenibacillus sp. LHD-38 TaxID=3072143 RepID=UPI00280E86BD|nr:peptidylprolyl isomerase [Paenibacillus sp. LHD-38]MDQ8737711.1 peptidylprolyl isomerase [Paenibacillus sp. LHD-38]
MKRTGHRIDRSLRLWMFSCFILFFLLLLLLLTGFVNGRANIKAPVQETIAMVNGKEIVKSRLYEMLIDTGGKKALEKQIVEELINQEASKKNIAVTDEDIDLELDILKREYDSPEEYRSKLAEDGFMDRSMRAQISMQLLLDKTRVTDADIQNYYDQNKARWAKQDAVRVSHILVQSKEQADVIAVKLKSGEDFAKLAGQFSLDPGAKSNGGDLGLIERGYLEQSFEDDAFALQPGEPAEITESSQGFHILVVTKRQESAAATLREREEQIRNELIDSEIYDLIGPWLEELRAGASIELLQLQ